MDSSSTRSHRRGSHSSIQYHTEEPTLLYAQYPVPYHHHYHSNRYTHRVPFTYTNPSAESSDQQRLVERHGHSYASQPGTVFDEEEAELQRQQQRLIEYQQRHRHRPNPQYFYQPQTYHDAGVGMGVEAERDGSQMIHSLLRQADELQDMIIEWMESVETEETEEEEEEEDQQEDERQPEAQATVFEDEPSGGISPLTRACLLSCSYRLTSRHWSTCHDDGSQLLPSVCSVCLDDICVGSQLVTLPCAHVFHTNCVLTWLERSQYCPLCRTPVNMNGGESEEDIGSTETETHSHNTTISSSSSYSSGPLITIAIGPPSSSGSHRRTRHRRFRY